MDERERIVNELKSGIMGIEKGLHGMEQNREEIKQVFTAKTVDDLNEAERHMRVAVACMWEKLERLEQEEKKRTAGDDATTPFWMQTWVKFRTTKDEAVEILMGDDPGAAVEEILRDGRFEFEGVCQIPFKEKFRDIKFVLNNVPGGGRQC